MSDQSPIVRFGRGLAAFFLLLSGPVSGCFLVRIVVLAHASAGWPSVPGELTRAQVGETEIGRYYAEVSYTFSVNGVPYIGNKIRASDGEFEFREGAEQQLQGLVPGQRVEVHYNPADPAQSLLRVGAGFQEYVLTFIPIALFSWGVLLSIRLYRTRDGT